jgi:hypothetical protein
MSDRILYLERPSFWTEDRDPECWYRGLKALAALEIEEGAIYGTPRSLWERRLKQVLSRRSIFGLFGMAPDREENLLLGAGFLEYNSGEKGWELAGFSKPLVAEGLKDREALKRLGIALLQRSPWIRLLVIRLIRGDWVLSGWRTLRDGRRKLKAGSTLILNRFSEEDDWFSGIESLCANGWFPFERSPAAIRLHPDVLSRDSRRDDFSWAPFKAPLYLFDYLGWLTGDGDLRIPPDVLKMTGMETGQKVQINASALLRGITKKEEDLRGFVPVEKVLRELREKIYLDQNADWDNFALWMDALMACALGKGAIEVLSVEPGQARHGRGLFGDRQHKMARWVVHEDFNDCIEEVERKILGANTVNRHKDE